MKNISAAVVVLCLVLGTAVQAEQGKAVYEVWSNITGTAVSDLTNVAQYPIFPTSRRLVDLFEAPLDYADNYGARLSAWIVPPVSGAYKFWIASDDASELYLSTNDDPANAVAIASVSGWTPSRDFEHLASDGVTREYPNQGPVTRTLIAGRPYYICALHKESTGGDNCAVAWQGPGFARRVIGEGFPADLWSDNPKGASPASPNPYSGELAPLNVQLSWVDPDAAFATGVTYDVYFSTDPNLPTAVISVRRSTAMIRVRWRTTPPITGVSTRSAPTPTSAARCSCAGHFGASRPSTRGRSSPCSLRAQRPGQAARSN